MGPDFGAIEFIEGCAKLNQIGLLKAAFEKNPHMLDELIASTAGKTEICHFFFFFCLKLVCTCLF